MTELLSGFKRPAAVVVTVLLLLQIGLFYAIPQNERVPLSQPLALLPGVLGNWQLLYETPIESDVAELLKADDTVSRMYRSPDGRNQASLFVAYFKSQKGGVAPHSPKVCLPGSGWTPLNSEIIAVQLPGRDHLDHVNRYTIAKGDNKSVVIYWYQSHDRIVASEYMAKLYSMYDSIRYRRSDTSMVRIVVPLLDKDDEARGQAVAKDFLDSAFPSVANVLPSLSAATK